MLIKLKNGHIKMIALFVLIPGLIAIFGCSKNSPVQPEAPTVYNESSDVAESVAGTIGENTG